MQCITIRNLARFPGAPKAPIMKGYTQYMYVYTRTCDKCGNVLRDTHEMLPITACVLTRIL